MIIENHHFIHLKYYKLCQTSSSFVFFNQFSQNGSKYYELWLDDLIDNVKEPIELNARRHDKPRTVGSLDLIEDVA